MAAFDRRYLLVRSFQVVAKKLLTSSLVNSKAKMENDFERR